MTSRRINGSNTTPTYYGEDSSVFTIKLHIGGTLVWKPKVEYRDGFVEYFDYFNCDEGSLLDLRRMVKQLRFCDKKVQFWVKVKEVPTNKELEIYVEHLYDDQWDYEVEISRSLGDDALFSDVQEKGSEQQSEREVEGPETMFEEGVENEVEVDVNEVDCVHSEEIFRSLADSDSERDFNDSEIVFQERNLKKEDFKFVLGMIFQSASEFKWAVKYHEALRRKDVKFVKNESRRVRACCFLARLYKDDFRLNMDWGRRQFQEHVKQTLHYQVTKHQAYRAKHKVRKELEGQDSDQFKLLNEYCHELKRSNPGTTVYS
nr:Zinc knuckle family protein [Ipomoea batatas]